MALRKLSIHGFKSIKNLDDFEPGKLTILIGANGAGKSNFVDFFRLLRAMSDQALQQYVQQRGGGDSFFYMGPKQTPEIRAQLHFGANAYEFTLLPKADGALFIGTESVQYTAGDFGGKLKPISHAVPESRLKELKDERAKFGRGPGVPHYVYNAVSNWTVYHFHDTSMLAQVRRDQPLRDRQVLRPEGENIAPFLLNLRESDRKRYELLRDTIRLIAPFFDDFVLEPEAKGENEFVRLEWRQKGSDFPFQPSQLSDGTLRFICLATALQQPSPPSTIVIDEPELGLHPYALSILASLIEAASERGQVIVATQSPALLDFFPPEAVVVVRREGGASTFSRLDTESLSEWLEEYSMGELWRKNVVQGGPVND